LFYGYNLDCFFTLPVSFDYLLIILTYGLIKNSYLKINKYDMYTLNFHRNIILVGGPILLTAPDSGVYGGVPSWLQTPPPPKCFKKLKNYFKRLLYFKGALCLYRICVKRQIILGNHVNEM
jgi:hypothetical protein